MRRLVSPLLAAAVAGCSGRDARAPDKAAVAEPTVAPAPPGAQSTPRPATSPSVAPAASAASVPALVKLPGGGCDPMPKEGSPCRQGDGYCVISWGKPGGQSTALWCRGGRWEIEHEANLP